MKEYFILLFILSFAIVPSASEQGDEDSIKKLENASYETKVRVLVSCDDEETKRSINSYVKRELRSLGGVKIVEQGEEWRISIITIRTKSKSGKFRGYAMGYTFIEITDRYMSESAIKTLIEHSDVFHKDNIGDIDMWLQVPIQKYITSGLYLDDTDSLRSMCEDLVVYFDTDILEPAKQAYFRLQQKTDKKSKK